MGTTTFSGPVKSGPIREGASANVGTLVCAQSAAITEAAVLNAASSGTMLCRTVFTAVNKGELDTMTISWDVTIS